MPFSITQINLSWTAPSGAVAGYNVYRGTTPGGENYAAPVNGGALVGGTSYSDTTAVAGTAYYYTVKAVNAAGGSAASNEAVAPQMFYWSGGAGTWSVGGGGWVNAAGQAVAWSNGNIAVFNGTNGGAVAISGIVSPLEIAFETNGYSLYSLNSPSDSIALPATGGVVRVDCTAATIAAPISSGALAKVGAGALVLSGSSGYTGETDVVAGALEVNGALAVGGAVLVESGGVLGGSGGVGTIYVVSGGALAPGGLTAAAVDLAAGAAIDYVLGTGNPGSDSLLVVAGAAEFAAGVVVDVTPAAAWGDGMYPLLDLLSVNYPSPVTLVLNWTAVGGGLGGHAYSFVASGHDIDLDVPVVNGVWSASGGGAWSAGGNWQGGAAPNAVGDTALLGAAVGDNTATITLAAAETLSSLSFSPAAGGSYVLNGGGALQLAAGGGSASVSISSGAASINAPVVLESNASVTAANGASLTISGGISQGGGSAGLTFSGGGSLTLSGSDSYVGGTTIDGGALVAAAASALPGSGVITIGGGGRLVFGGRQRHWRRARRLCRRAGVGGTDASPKRQRGRFGRHFPR